MLARSVYRLHLNCGKIITWTCAVSLVGWAFLFAGALVGPRDSGSLFACSFSDRFAPRFAAAFAGIAFVLAGL